MKLKSLKIKNFRGYRNLTEIKFNDLTVFVGKNDVGKSTILDALDIFFNDGKGAVKLDDTDVNAIESQDGNNEIMIAITLSELPNKIIIDDSVETSLEDEYMLNEDGELEIVKIYKKAKLSSTFIRACHPSNPRCANLLLKKNSDLKKIVNEENIDCKNQTVNSLLRKAIWNHYSDDLQLDTQDIDISKEDAKEIWEKLSVYMPVYSLFQADRKNNDDDNEIQDPLKEAVKQILADEQVQDVLSKIAAEVEDKLKEVSNRTLEKLREMDPTIADSLNPVIPPARSLKWQDVFKSVSITGDSDIPINKRGSGVKRLILLNFFRAEAERRAEKSNGTGLIYAIEEPETSQHTANQLMLIDAFKALAAENNTQVILTTHSSYIVKQLNFDDLRLIQNSNDNNGKEILEVIPAQLQYPSLNEVNYIAFNEPTEEYHDELYGYIEYQGWKDEYNGSKERRTYQKQCQNGNYCEQYITLTEYIRNQIHHPENHANQRYTREELIESIDSMREFICIKKKRDVIHEPND